MIKESHKFTHSVRISYWRIFNKPFNVFNFHRDFLKIWVDVETVFPTENKPSFFQ